MGHVFRNGFLSVEVVKKRKYVWAMSGIGFEKITHTFWTKIGSVRIFRTIGHKRTQNSIQAVTGELRSQISKRQLSPCYS